MSKRKNYHTEDIYKIITGSPNWLIKWGMTVLLFLFLLVSLASTLYSYPDTIKTEATAKILEINKDLCLSQIYEGHFAFNVKKTEKTSRIHTGQSVKIKNVTLSSRATPMIGKIVQVRASPDGEDKYLLIIKLKNPILDHQPKGIFTSNSFVNMEVTIGQTFLFKQIANNLLSNFKVSSQDKTR